MEKSPNNPQQKSSLACVGIVGSQKKTHKIPIFCKKNTIWVAAPRWGLDSEFPVFSHCVFLSLFFFIFFSRECWLFSWIVHECTVYETHKHHFSAIFSLKLGLTILFTHLKIILLQYFQFSTVSKRAKWKQNSPNFIFSPFTKITFFYCMCVVYFIYKIDFQKIERGIDYNRIYSSQFYTENFLFGHRQMISRLCLWMYVNRVVVVSWSWRATA